MNTIFFTPDKQLHLGWKAAILLSATLIIQPILTAAYVTAAVYRITAGGLERQAALQAAKETAAALPVQVGAAVATIAFILALLYWLIVRVEKTPLRLAGMGLALNLRTPLSLLLGFVLAGGLTVATILGGVLSGALRFDGLGFSAFGLLTVARNLVLTSLLALVVGFGEEIIFRGYLQTRLIARYGEIAGLSLTAALFALTHPFLAAPQPLLYLATVLLVGLLLGILARGSGSLWAGISLHIFWNYFRMGVAAARSGAEEHLASAPLLVFDALNPAAQMTLEFAVILAATALIAVLSLSSQVARRSSALAAA
jgi:hypothetical protein